VKNVVLWLSSQRMFVRNVLPIPSGLIEIGELGRTLAVTSNRMLRINSCPADDGGDTFLRNVYSYRRHMA
jgi:hypothetical protein